MLEILTEFSESVYYAEHIHQKNCEVTVIFCGRNRLYQYQDDFKLEFFTIERSLLQLAIQWIRLRKKLKLLEFLSSILKEVSITNLVFAGNYLIGIMNQTKLAFFSDDYKSALLNGNFDKNILSLILRTVDLSCMLKTDCFIVYIALFGLQSTQNSLTIEKDLYLAMFGLENYKRRTNILLLFLSNGHIWFLPLHDMSKPQFLYSLCDCCIKTSVNQNGDCVNVYSKNKMVSFKSNLGLLDVKETWINSKNGKIINFCSETCDDCCPGKLIVEEKTVMIRGGCLSNACTNEEKINILRMSLNSLCTQRDTLKELIKSRLATLKQLKPLADASAETKDFFDLTFSDKWLEVEIKADYQAFLPFCMILSAQTHSRTFYSNLNSLKIPFDTAQHFNTALCLLCQNGIWITSNPTRFQPSTFKS